MTQPFAAPGSSALWALVCLVLPAGGQSTFAGAKPSGLFGYDASQEITLHGTGSRVLTDSDPGAIMGLGWFASRGKDALSLAPGQQVAVTGMTKTVKNKQVFLARLVNVDGQVYTIRNEHGLVLSPEARERLSPASGRP